MHVCVCVFCVCKCVLRGIYFGHVKEFKGEKKITLTKDGSLLSPSGSRAYRSAIDVVECFCLST